MVNGASRHYRGLDGRFVTFETNDPDVRPVPEPELLALHATAAKVANASGALDLFYEFLDAKKHMGTLPSDGTFEDACLLRQALMQVYSERGSCARLRP